MNTVKSLGLVGLAVSALFATQAFATTCPTAPATGTQTQGAPVCIAPSGQDGPNTGLINYFGPGGSLIASGPGIDVYNDQHTPSSFWSIGGTGISANKIVLEIAGNANSNTFGIFDPTNSANQLQLFSGTASAGWSSVLFNNGGGNFTVNYFDATGAFQGSDTASFGATNMFGYYLGTANNGTFFSAAGMNEPTGNPLYYPNGAPHMVAYQGDSTNTLKVGNTTGLFLNNEFLLAWEDLPFARSDLDYNDFVVLVESVHSVPEPAALGMFGLGVLLLGGFTVLRRRSYKA
jgi:hypothetical protein